MTDLVCKRHHPEALGIYYNTEPRLLSLSPFLLSALITGWPFHLKTAFEFGNRRLVDEADSSNLQRCSAERFATKPSHLGLVDKVNHSFYLTVIIAIADKTLFLRY